jgi:hypothetical protein
MNTLLVIYLVGAGFFCGGAAALFLFGSMFGIAPKGKTVVKAGLLGLSWPVLIPCIWVWSAWDMRKG